MGKFVDKRRKFQSRHEIDKRESKALAKAEAKQELLGMEHLQRSTSKMREYLFGHNGGVVSDPHAGITFLNTPDYWIDAIVPPGMAAAQRQPTPGGHFAGEPVEIPVYAMEWTTERPNLFAKRPWLRNPEGPFITTGLEEDFGRQSIVSVIDSYSPGLVETIGWGGPRTLNISSMESMGTYSPKGVEVREVGEGEFTDEEPVCPNCGRRHGSFSSIFGDYFDMLRGQMARDARRGGVIDGEFHHVQEHNLLTQDPKDPE